MDALQFKSVNGQASNVDDAKGIVECFVAAIGNKDSVGDIVASGAFDGSLKRRKPRVVWGHDWNQPIGKVLEIYEVGAGDPRLPWKMKMAGVGGVFAKVQFNLMSERGREAFASVQFFGEEQEWSIGYKTLDSVYDPTRQANVLKEVELYEVSPVLHGANQLTGTISVKSADPGSDDDRVTSFRKSKWDTFDFQWAKNLKEEHPDIWSRGGNVKGNDQWEILSKILEQGGAAKTDDQIAALELREAWVARHKGNFRLPGVIAQIKWLAVGEQGESKMKEVVREAIERKKKGEDWLDLFEELEDLELKVVDDVIDVKAEGDACPVATQDVVVNIRNRQKAIDDVGYGPLNPNEPNEKFWAEKAERWDVTADEARKQTCGNCAAFIKTPRMLDCIEKGLGGEQDDWDVIEAGDLGYCEGLDFKCAAARTCDAWIVGGPVTEEKGGKPEDGDEYEERESDDADFGSMYKDMLARALVMQHGRSIRIREFDKNQVIYDVAGDEDTDEMTFRVSYHFDGEEFMFGDRERVEAETVYLDYEGRSKEGDYEEDSLYYAVRPKMKSTSDDEAPQFDEEFLGKALGAIGDAAKKAGRNVPKPAKIDPDAIDKDNDGMVQDGTTAERPVAVAGNVADTVSNLNSKIKDFFGAPTSGADFADFDADRFKSGSGIFKTSDNNRMTVLKRNPDGGLEVIDLRVDGKNQEKPTVRKVTPDELRNELAGQKISVREDVGFDDVAKTVDTSKVDPAPPEYNYEQRKASKPSVTPATYDAFGKKLEADFIFNQEAEDVAASIGLPERDFEAENEVVGKLLDLIGKPDEHAEAHFDEGKFFYYKPSYERGEKISADQIKPGMIIEQDGDFYVATGEQFTDVTYGSRSGLVTERRNEKIPALKVGRIHSSVPRDKKNGAYRIQDDALPIHSPVEANIVPSRGASDVTSADPTYLLGEMSPQEMATLQRAAISSDPDALARVVREARKQGAIPDEESSRIEEVVLNHGKNYREGKLTRRPPSRKRKNETKSLKAAPGADKLNQIANIVGVDAPQERVTGDVMRGYGPRRGNLERLLRYWRPIMKKPGGFRRCRVILADHPELYPLENICAWLHHETTGLWPNEGCHHPGMKNCRKKLKNVRNGSIWSDSEWNDRLARRFKKGADMWDEEEEDLAMAQKALKYFLDTEPDFVSWLGNDSNWMHEGQGDDDKWHAHDWVKPEGGDCGCGCAGKGDCGPDTKNWAARGARATVRKIPGKPRDGDGDGILNESLLADAQRMGRQMKPRGASVEADLAGYYDLPETTPKKPRNASVEADRFGLYEPQRYGAPIPGRPRKPSNASRAADLAGYFDGRGKSDVLSELEEKGMGMNTSSKLVEVLRHTLSDVIAFSFRAQGHHWNVEGEDFAQYHALFGAIYEDVYDSIDPLAENIRKLGGYSPFRLVDLAAMNDLPDQMVTSDARVMAQDLLECNKVVLSALKSAFSVADAMDEQGVADFLAGRIDMHQKWAWQLSASIGMPDLVKDAWDDIDVKAFRRRGGKGGLGRIGRRGVVKPAQIDPNAVDADGDGIVQDGTTAARPVVATKPRKRNASIEADEAGYFDPPVPTSAPKRPDRPAADAKPDRRSIPPHHIKPHNDALGKRAKLLGFKDVDAYKRFVARGTRAEFEKRERERAESREGRKLSIEELDKVARDRIDALGYLGHNKDPQTEYDWMGRLHRTDGEGTIDRSMLTYAADLAEMEFDTLWYDGGRYSDGMTLDWPDEDTLEPGQVWRLYVDFLRERDKQRLEFVDENYEQEVERVNQTTPHYTRDPKRRAELERVGNQRALVRKSDQEIEVVDHIGEILVKSGRVLSQKNMERLREALGLLQSIVSDAEPVRPGMAMQMKSAAQTDDYLIIDTNPEDMFALKSLVDRVAAKYDAEVVIDDVSGDWLAIKSGDGNIAGELAALIGTTDGISVKGFGYGSVEFQCESCND